MESVRNKVLKVLESKKMCFIATHGRGLVDNAMVAYWSEGYDVYFGSYADTIKNKNLKLNPHVAICIDNVQIHGLVEMLERGSDEYRHYVKKYCEKFPNYDFYFEHETNEFFRVKPLYIRLYDSENGCVKTEKIILDEKYYAQLTNW